jgi:hypothetical protein
MEAERLFGFFFGEAVPSPPLDTPFDATQDTTPVEGGRGRTAVFCYIPDELAA